MLNIKEVTEQLKSEGIADSEEIVIRWILDGKIKAKRTNHYKIDFSIKPGDLAAFILEKKIENKSKQFGADYQQWEKTFSENQLLKERIVELESTVRIEQAKYRSLKKMLKAKYSHTEINLPLTFNSLLGLADCDDQDLLKKEFKKLLKSLHPDRGGDERLFIVFYDHYRKTFLE
jgi:hypothetical protein